MSATASEGGQARERESGAHGGANQPRGRARGAIGTGGNEAHLSVTVEQIETRPQAQEMGTCMLFTVIDLAEGSRF